MNIYTVGGFDEVGKNMTCVDLGGDAFIFDAGLYLPPIVELEEEDRVYSEKKLREINAIPNDYVLNSLRNRVRGIFVSHAHLDHVGAVPWLAGRYNASVFGSPFTIEVLNTILRDENQKIKNKIRTVNPNSSYKIGKYDVDFINITHSTIQTSLIALHTKQGAVLYANDFKLDNSPIVGKKPAYDKIKKIAKEGVKALVVDSLYSGTERKTPSEKIARDLLEDVLMTTENKNCGITITTFSSHIARLKSIVDFGNLLGREVVFIGRSLNKYVTAAHNVKMCPFYNKIKLVSYKNQVKKMLSKINQNRKKYLLVCTGHQGEPGSILERLSKNELPFIFSNKDHLIFSSSIIPTQINIDNRARVEKRLKSRGVRIFDNVHVSGHAGREDLRDLIEMVQPEHIIPAHGGLDKTKPMAELAGEMGYKLGSQCHLMQNGKMLKI